jgi:hypothetical protein
MITRAEYDHVAILLEDRSGKLHIFEAVGALRHAMLAVHTARMHACAISCRLLRTCCPWAIALSHTGRQ